MNLAPLPSGWESIAASAGLAEFRIRAEASPQLLMRIFGLLAQQDKMPDHASVELTHGTLEMGFAATGLPRHRAEVMAEKIRSMVGTHSVQLAWQTTLEKGRKSTRPECRSVSGLHGDRAGIA